MQSTGKLSQGGVLCRSCTYRPRLGHTIDPFGPGTLLVGGVALLCASVPSLCGLVMPLSGMGLVLGLVGFLRAKGQSRLLLRVAGMAVGGMVFLAALLFPNLLGPRYLAFRGSEAVDPTVIRVIPVPGSPDNAALRDPEWVDASQAALQQGPMQVQVLSASISPVKVNSSPTKTIGQAEYLFIRLRTQQAEAASDFATKRTPVTGPRSEQPRPTLTDKTGRVYQAQDIQQVAAVENKRRSAVFPVSFHDEVIVFETPRSGLEFLRLEVPAEAWGRKGAFRFTIPGSMIEHKRSSAAGQAAGR